MLPKYLHLMLIVSVICIALIYDVSGAKKKKKKPKSEGKKDSDLFDSKTLKCLVCQSLMDEFLNAIHKIDPKKMVDTGTFRVDPKGNQKRSVVCMPMGLHTTDLFWLPFQIDWGK